ncbi:MAG: hypothetical protein LBP79_02400, partial [Clostridiales bacterium]|nr:hypothetical protein [Clostridiales bacterium]
YAEELRRNAIKTLCADAKDRKIGRVSGVSKAGVYNWIKKLRGIRKSELCGTALNELDDLLNPS